MKVGFIGLGNVGAKLAGSLLRKGFDLTVLDANPAAMQPLQAAGARVAVSAKSLAEDNDVIITCLPSPKISAEVLEAEDGVIAGLDTGKVWLEMSSTDADEVRRLGERVEAKGADALDSPVSGGCHRAATGNIAIFTGGRRQAFEKVLPLLSTMGRNILHTGDLGTASIMKVATNYLAGVQLISTGANVNLTFSMKVATVEEQVTVTTKGARPVPPAARARSIPRASAPQCAGLRRGRRQDPVCRQRRR